VTNFEIILEAVVLMPPNFEERFFMKHSVNVDLKGRLRNYRNN